MFGGGIDAQVTLDKRISGFDDEWGEEDWAAGEVEKDSELQNVIKEAAGTTENL